MTQSIIAYSQDASHPVDAVMVLLHGLGASGHDFEEMAAEFVRGTSLNLKLILPHAPVRPLTIAGGEAVPSWYDILETGAHRVLNQKHLQTSVNLVKQLLEKESNVPLFVAGFSQGGAVAIESFLTLQIPLTGCLAMSTYTPNNLPSSHSHAQSKTPILMQHGTLDPVVNYQLGKASAQSLTAAGFDVTFESYPMQHQLCLPQIKAIQQWLRSLLFTQKPA